MEDSAPPDTSDTTITTTSSALTAIKVPATTIAFSERTEEDKAFLFKRFPGALLTESKGTI